MPPGSRLVQHASLNRLHDRDREVQTAYVSSSVGTRVGDQGGGQSADLVRVAIPAVMPLSRLLSTIFVHGFVTETGVQIGHMAAGRARMRRRSHHCDTGSRCHADERIMDCYSWLWVSV